MPSISSGKGFWLHPFTSTLFGTSTKEESQKHLTASSVARMDWTIRAWKVWGHNKAEFNQEGCQLRGEMAVWKLLSFSSEPSECEQTLLKNVRAACVCVLRSEWYFRNKSCLPHSSICKGLWQPVPLLPLKHHIQYYVTDFKIICTKFNCPPLFKA